VPVETVVVAVVAAVERVAVDGSCPAAWGQTCYQDLIFCPSNQIRHQSLQYLNLTVGFAVGFEVELKIHHM